MADGGFAEEHSLLVAQGNGYVRRSSFLLINQLESALLTTLYRFSSKVTQLNSSIRVCLLKR
jgi:hypothetical protein